jgi:hypothetical protein
MTKRDPMTVRLWRENRHVVPRVSQDIWDLVMGATFLFLACVIALLLV